VRLRARYGSGGVDGGTGGGSGLGAGGSSGGGVGVCAHAGIASTMTTPATTDACESNAFMIVDVLRRPANALPITIG
jgi:hypothetical protein